MVFFEDGKSRSLNFIICKKNSQLVKRMKLIDIIIILYTNESGIFAYQSVKIFRFKHLN